MFIHLLLTIFLKKTKNILMTTWKQMYLAITQHTRCVKRFAVTLLPASHPLLSVTSLYGAKDPFFFILGEGFSEKTSAGIYCQWQPTAPKTVYLFPFIVSYITPYYLISLLFLIFFSFVMFYWRWLYILIRVFLCVWIKQKRLKSVITLNVQYCL